MCESLLPLFGILPSALKNHCWDRSNSNAKFQSSQYALCTNLHLPRSAVYLKRTAVALRGLTSKLITQYYNVSLGSLASMEEAELKDMVWGLANSSQPFLWVIRPGLVNGSEWTEFMPQGFAEATGERGYIVKWAPQKQVLAHDSVGRFWSHCGWNSTLESIAEGVPMICKPCDADHASHVWKIGLHIENSLERNEVEVAVRRLMVDKEGMEMRQRAMDLKEKIEQSIGKGASSNNHLVDLIKFILD